MDRKRGLFFLTHLLGNSTQSRAIKQAVSQIPWIDATYFEFTESDRRRYREHTGRPVFDHFFSNALSMRRKFRDVGPRERFDFVFMNAREFAVAMLPFLEHEPTLLSLDATDIQVYQLVGRSKAMTQSAVGVSPRLKTWLYSRITSTTYAAAFQRIDLFLPWSDWCAMSLKEDYQIENSRISVLPCPIDTSIWSPRSRRSPTTVRHLLFVGNAFARKGGQMFVKLLDSLATEGFTGTIASNDPTVEDFLATGQRTHLRVERGLTHDRITALVDLFRSADLLVLPTWNDTFGFVLLEAAAVGVPTIARDVGGAGTVVKDGETGLLMPYDATIQEWREAILSLARDPDRVDRMRKASRDLVVNSFSLDRFRSSLASAIASLVGG